MKKAEQVQWQDVQGLVLSGYPKLHFAAYVPWCFNSTDHQQHAWLRDLIGRLMRVEAADQRELGGTSGHPLRPMNLKEIKKSGAVDVWVVNVALTATGLKKLGVSEKELLQFSGEFREGMAPERAEPDAPMPRRCNLLGDVGESSPQHWQWGGWNANGKIDGMLLLYAKTEDELEKLTEYEMEQARMFGLEFLEDVSANKKGGVLVLKGRLYQDRKEHFGFKDGISLPIIAGTSRELRRSSTKELRSPKEARIHVVKPGEFVLGYLNERGTRASYSSAPGSGAHRSKAMKERPRDLLRNGTHLVFRQLEQDVGAFHRDTFLTAQRMRGKNGKDLKTNCEWVAARLIGRYQSGEPLVPPSIDSVKRQKSESSDNGEPLSPASTESLKEQERRRNDFLYYYEDRFGLACPLGAHIRRANPRDLIGPDPDTALRLSKMHRIMRRGRPYGKRWTKSTRADEEQRGMLFICLNADIAGQFEFIQHTWINNGRFSGLYGETDPLSHFSGEGRVLTIQRRPTSERVDLNRYITVRGGAYFFLPGIQALRFLAG